MKSKLQIALLASLVLSTINTLECFSQTYNLIQNFENGGTGSDACWTGYNQTSVPSTLDFFTTTSVVQSGVYAGGMYSCCGGPTTNDPTYYISPALLNGSHTVLAYIRQSSFFNEDFEIGTTTDSLGTNFTAIYTKSIWPTTPAWEQASIIISTNSSNNRIAFRVPPASLKTYYLDSIVISNSGNSTVGCNYMITTSINDLEVNLNGASVYPNPFTNELKLYINSKSSAEIILCDEMGRELLRHENSAGETILNTDNVSKGLYLLRYSDGKSNKIFKVIKQ